MSPHENQPWVEIPGVELPVEFAGSAKAALQFMVHVLADHDVVAHADADELVQHLLKRELLGNTAIGTAVALPHAVSTAVQKTALLVARSRVGIPWKAEAGGITRIGLVVAPLTRPSDFFRAMESAVRRLVP